jgi:CDGSH-type Zn-finger protein
LDGGAQEAAPPVNTIRVRENGPLAFHGALALKGQPAAFRATLCRCGRSQHKPFCDGSHHGGEGVEPFMATGDPTAQKFTPLPDRSGTVTVELRPNGPLLVTGAVEICSGTGRTVTVTQKTALCRCGHSNNKPFCDGTHAKIGFKAS